MQFLITHGVLILFAAVIVEQTGVPLPALPWLLAAGALSATGKLNFGLCVGYTALACVIADSFWFFLGRYQGPRVMGWLCRLSLAPDSCVHNTRGTYMRYGLWGLLVSKFVPGLNTVVQPMAGMSGTPYPRFAGVDAIGSVLYTTVLIGLGNSFSTQIDRVASKLIQIGGAALVLLAGLATLYMALKYMQRKQVLRQLRMARITAAELRRMLDTEEKPAIYDLRSQAELQYDPTIILGAVHIELEMLERRIDSLPRDRDIVVYCSCPNEATAAHMALLLRKNGITRVHPLQGGLVAWRNENYPTEIYALQEIEAVTTN